MGYNKRYRDLDVLEGVGDGGEEFYLDDANGYISKYDFLAVKLPEDKLCEKCGRPACLVTGQSYPYDWNKPHHLLCLRCRDEWWEYHQEHTELSIRNWERIFKEFLAQQN